MHPYCGFFFADAGKDDWVECEIVEDRYKVDEGYKVTLKPLDDNHAYQHFYQEDFIYMLERGQIIEKTNDNMSIYHEKWLEELTPNALLVHEGDYVE